MFRSRVGFVRTILAVGGLLLAIPARGAAQPAPPPPPPPPAPAAPQPEPPPPPWAGSIGAGLAITSGNSDTLNINVSFDLTSNPKARNVFKAEGLYLRGETDSELAVDRTALKLRDEYNINKRTFVFGQFGYLRDTFKGIQYLVSPTVGMGYKLVDQPKATFTVDGGLGFSWEKNPYRDVRVEGAVTAGENFVYKFSETASFTEGFGALWVMDDFGDALYTFKTGITAGITQKSQLKVELIDTYKTRPPEGVADKNDIALVTAIVYKF
jgi:putative salt-induced outer membrane protein